ncbi:MAG TPA: hypothetical protein VGF97_17900, partial [Rhizomicrobium sp.]
DAAMPAHQNPSEDQPQPPWQTSLFAMVNQDSRLLGIPSESEPTQVGITLDRLFDVLASCQFPERRTRARQAVRRNIGE